jgi:hypothetical protein
MFGPKISTVFKSRWQAVGWALSMLLLAYCSVPALDRAQDDGAKATEQPHKSAWAY